MFPKILDSLQLINCFFFPKSLNVPFKGRSINLTLISTYIKSFRSSLQSHLLWVTFSHILEIFDVTQKSNLTHQKVFQLYKRENLQKKCTNYSNSLTLDLRNSLPHSTLAIFVRTIITK